MKFKKDKQLLNIFYNQENEIKFLEELLSEELNVINNEEIHQEWSKKAKKEFFQYRHKLKLERRRKKKKITVLPGDSKILRVVNK